MKTLKLWINTGFAGCDYYEEQCKEECDLFLINHIDCGWELN